MVLDKLYNPNGIVASVLLPFVNLRAAAVVDEMLMKSAEAPIAHARPSNVTFLHRCHAEPSPDSESDDMIATWV